MDSNQQLPSNPLLQNLRLPGETIRLPSRALTYTTDQVAPEVLESGELHVYPMTTYEEILMKSSDLLFTGQAIVQTFSRCIPQVYNPLELLAKDVDYLLVILRKITYGNEVEIKFQHDCNNAKNHTYAVDVQQFVRKSKELNPAEFNIMNTHTLKNGQTLHVRPFLLRDVISASQRAMSQPSIQDQTDLEFVNNLSDTIIEGLAPGIVDVDSITNPQHIKEWLSNITPPLIAEISQLVERVNKFGIEFEADHICKDCGEPLRLTIPLNPQSFFTQPSEQEIRI